MPPPSRHGRGLQPSGLPRPPRKAFFSRLRRRPGKWGRKGDPDRDLIITSPPEPRVFSAFVVVALGRRLLVLDHRPVLDPDRRRRLDRRSRDAPGVNWIRYERAQPLKSRNHRLPGAI